MSRTKDGSCGQWERLGSNPVTIGYEYETGYGLDNFHYGQRKTGIHVDVTVRATERATERNGHEIRVSSIRGQAKNLVLHLRSGSSNLLDLLAIYFLAFSLTFRVKEW